MFTRITETGFPAGVFNHQNIWLSETVNNGAVNPDNSTFKNP